MNLRLLALFVGLLPAWAFSQTVTTFNYTGGVQTYTVPACVSSLQVTAKGGRGGGANGANGATVTATLAVVPGQVLEIRVGGQGSCPTGGYNGGGQGNAANGTAAASCGGGGATDIRVAPYNLNNRLIVASGGGEWAVARQMRRVESEDAQRDRRERTPSATAGGLEEPIPAAQAVRRGQRVATRVLRAHWELVETVAWIPASMPHPVLEEGEGISVVAVAVATASAAVQLAVVEAAAVRV